jgi:hypothetical protein
VRHFPSFFSCRSLSRPTARIRRGVICGSGPSSSMPRPRPSAATSPWALLPSDEVCTKRRTPPHPPTRRPPPSTRHPRPQRRHHRLHRQPYGCTWPPHTACALQPGTSEHAITEYLLHRPKNTPAWCVAAPAFSAYQRRHWAKVITSSDRAVCRGKYTSKHGDSSRTSSQLKFLGGHIQRSGWPISHTKPADIAQQTPKRKEEVENKTIFRPS